jgi:hypothetical protein
MSERLTVELSDDVARRARALAAAANRPVEEAVAEWIGRAVTEPTVEALPDDELLALCDGMMPAGEQRELSGLLARHREGALPDPDRVRLDELMAAYERGMLLKARAWKEAVGRGLRAGLNGHGA